MVIFRRHFYIRFFWILILVPVLAFAGQSRHGSPDISYLTYIQNKGQWNSNVLYKSEFRGGTIFLENSAFTYVFKPKEGIHRHDVSKKEKNKSTSTTINFHVLRMDFEGAIAGHAVIANEKQSFYNNYFVGNDPTKWASLVGIYKAVVHKNLYKGIDVKVFGRGNNVRYDFIVSPGADPTDIKLKFTGQENITMREDQLVLQTSEGDVIQEAPAAFQELKDGSVTEVPCCYVLTGNSVSIKITGSYNKKLPLIIDPTLIFSTYTGSIADNWGMSASFDALGNGYTAGLTFAQGYPLSTGAFQTVFSGPGGYPGGDITLSKFNATGTTLLFSTYLGGDSIDTPQSITVDNNNCLVVLGRTYSPNFPVIIGCYDVIKGLKSDIIVTKFNTTGTALIGSTFIGGSGNDGINIDDDESFIGGLKKNYADDGRGAVHVDAANNIYVASCTASTDFPVTVGCFQPNSGGMQDGCVFKFNPALTSLVFSSYLGGSSDDAAYNIALDTQNGLYVTGGTQSTNFPTTPGALITTYGGNIDGFITHISSSGGTILQSTFIGTSLYDQSYFVQTDKDNDIYIFGQCSGNYPMSPNTYSNVNSGQFIHKLDSTLSTTFFSTQFGAGNGTPDIVPSAFLVDNCKSIYISGWGGTLGAFNGSTSTTNGMPITPLSAFQSTTDGSDFYFASFKQNASSLDYATFFGGPISQEHVDGGTSCFDKTGVMYQAICSSCGANQDMPTTPSAWSQTNNSNNCNNGLVKFKMDLINTLATASLSLNDVSGCAPFTASLVNTSSNAASFVWYFGDGGTSTLSALTHTYANTGTYVITLIASDSTTCNLKDTFQLTVVVFPPAQLVPKLTAKNMCKGEGAQLTINFPQGNSFVWSPAATLSNPNIYNPIASPSSNTIYSLTVNDSLCEVVSIRTVQVNVYENITDISADKLCSGDSVTVRTSSTYASYLWNTGQTTPKIKGLLSGLYTVNTTDTNGCKGFDSLRIYRLIKIDSFSVRACQGTVTQFSSPIGNYQYSWTPASFLNSATISNPIAGPIVSTIYTLHLANGPCISSNTFSIYLKPVPDAFIKTDGRNFCIEDTVGLSTPTSPSYSNYTWNTGDSTSSIIVSAPGNYTVIVRDTNGCLAIDTINVRGTPPFSIKPSRVVICNGQYITLYADTGYTYRWFPEHNNIKGTTLFNPVVNPISTSIYTVLISNGRCFAPVNYTVFVDPSPPLSLLSHYESLIPGESVQLQAFADTSCVWYPDIDLSCTLCNAPVASPLETTVYYAYVINALGCSSTNTVIVEVIPTLYVPSSFSPNNDGLNDIFKPVFSGFEKMSLTIFDRWGEEIYSNNNLEAGWNGTFQGELAKSDYYVYQVIGTDNRHKVVEKTGTFLLLR